MAESTRTHACILMRLPVPDPTPPPKARWPWQDDDCVCEQKRDEVGVFYVIRMECPQHGYGGRLSPALNLAGPGMTS